MTRRARPAIFILSFALVPWALQACGTAANVLEGDDTPGTQLDAGLGFGGSIAMGAGASRSSGGFAGLPASAGGTMAAGGLIGAGGGPGAGGGLLGDPAGTLRALAEELCSVPTTFPCLTLSVSGAPPRATTEELKTLCRQKTESAQYTTFGDRCFEQWALNAFCALQRTDYCPCDADAGPCTFAPENYDYGPACAETLAKLTACASYKESFGTEDGIAGSYDWADGQVGCSVHGRARSGVDTIEASCTGPPNGVQACICRVNGIILVDHVQALIGAENTFYADDCRNVASQLAVGRCADILDCCFTTKDGSACSCGAHPELAGYATCAALADSSAAVVNYDICPAYRP